MSLYLYKFYGFILSIGKEKEEKKEANISGGGSDGIKLQFISIFQGVASAHTHV